ncbi:Flp pilus assembly complex ATPase component TadA [Candidatus Woesearchaeota archaeon]|nr:Flp pilus assembly complex ATPase component TadA [Candidatus Woesearchaeota archaeon]
MDISIEKLNDLSSILVRYTIGFGLIEVLLEDEKIQDITINAPVGENPIYVVHQDYGHCFTNIYPSNDDVQGWATKFRILSGRALDEANPILDTELILPKSRARVAIITSPLNPFGLAYAFRRHRDKPWTFPLFMKNKMINSMAAGLLSFVIDGNRSLIFAGTRSSGKCVGGDTLIQFADGGIKKIKDLVGKEKKQIDDGYIYEPISDLSVKSLDGFQISNQKITDVWKRSSPDKLIKIRTKSGKEIITTCEHPYFVYYKGLKNKRADELKIKDLIASPRKIEVIGKEISIDLKGHPYLIRENDDYYILKGKTNSSIVYFPKLVDADIAEFVGLILGDGHIDKTKLEFHNSCVELREKYIRLIKMFNVPYRVFKSRTTTVVQVSSRILSSLLSEVFEIPLGNKANKIIIPQVILKSKNEVLAAFLRGYFDTDGSVSKDKRMIELVSASKSMIEYLRFALLRFGITTFNCLKIINGVPYYRNYIYGRCVVDFFNNIGFSHPFKKEVLNSLVTKKYIENTNVDTIPQGNEIFRLLRKKLRVSPLDLRKDIGKDYWSYENDQYRVTRNWFSKIICFYKERYIKLLSLNEKVNNLRNFVNFDGSLYFKDIARLKELFGLSYGTLAANLGFSERGVRKILKNFRIGNISNLARTSSIINFFNKRFVELEFLKNLDLTMRNVPLFVNAGLVSYVDISKATSIPETTLKYYAYGPDNINIPVQKQILLESYLVELRSKLLSNFKEAVDLLSKLNSMKFLISYLDVGILISYLRNELNISNSEFLSDDVSITTVTNFFMGKGVSTLEVFQSIVKTILNIYDKVVAKEVFDLICETEQLAHSDIFWDEIVSIEVVNKIDDYVYDLTVDRTHNFVANGIIAHNTSLLGSAIAEIMRKYRIVSIEDTLEIPLEAYRRLGYNVQQMKVRSALATGGTEVGADEGIRTSLRMGDSSLIVGEIRSVEAKSLFESMRIGALANVVAGTIHGESPYGVFDRVVNDLGVPRTSFKATDIIVLSNPVRSPDGLSYFRRVLQITEVRKHWEEDPLKEGGFVDLMRYNPKTDQLEITDDLKNGDSEILKSIAGNVKDWAGNWAAVWDNILLRAKIKQTLLDYSLKLNRPDILEADFIVQANDMFHIVSENVKSMTGVLDSKKIYNEWVEWLKKGIQGERTALEKE